MVSVEDRTGEPLTGGLGTGGVEVEEVGTVVVGCGGGVDVGVEVAKKGVVEPVRCSLERVVRIGGWLLLLLFCEMVEWVVLVVIRHNIYSY